MGHQHSPFARQLCAPDALENFLTVSVGDLRPCLCTRRAVAAIGCALLDAFPLFSREAQREQFVLEGLNVVPTVG